MSERQEERLEPSLEREGAGGSCARLCRLLPKGRKKSLLMKKGLGLMEEVRALP